MKFRLKLLAVALVVPMTLQAASGEGNSDYVHQTKPGDTIISIARELMQKPNNWEKLRQYNHVAEPRHLQPGQAIRIPVKWLRGVPTTATVIQVTGSAETTPTPQEKPNQVAKGATLSKGSTVKTGKDGYVTLKLQDDSTITVQANSQVKVENLESFRGTSAVSSVFRVVTGRIESAISKLKGPSANFKINTPTATIGVRGTKFRVGVPEDNSNTTYSEVTEGLVGVRGSQQSTTVAVSAGFGTIVDNTAGTPRSPIKLPPAVDVSGLPTLQERVLMRFKFAPVANVKGYRSQISKDPEFHQIVAEGVFNGNEVKFGDLPDDNYWLRVRAIDQTGLEGQDGVHAFKLKARPEAPFTSAPLNRAKLRAETVEFQWTEAAEAETYRLQLALDPKFTRLVIDQKGIGSTKFSPAEKMQPADYYWRMASVRKDGDQGPFGDPQSFVLKPLPANPEPPVINDKELVFQWSAEPQQTFLFQFARDEKFENIVTELKLNEPKAVVARPSEGGTYYMRVKATDPDGFVGPFTGIQKIEVPGHAPWFLLLFLIPLIN